MCIGMCGTEATSEESCFDYIYSLAWTLLWNPIIIAG